MPAIHCEINIPETESLMFKKALRHLFNSTFVLREKEEKLYRFIARESNRFEISQYLQVIGYDILVEEKAGVAMLTLSERRDCGRQTLSSLPRSSTTCSWYCGRPI